jgi:hypothetical protein
MAQVYRYPEISRVSSALDPMADAIGWIRGMRSVGYVSDVLRRRFGFSRAKDIEEAAKSISFHADVAIGLLEQGLASKPELAYLPIYYALLDLAKIIIILDGKLSLLQAQRMHGASWSGISKASHDLLTDSITLWGQGAIPLFYQALTGSLWPETWKKDRAGNPIRNPKREIILRNIYPYIPGVGHEYQQAYGFVEDQLAVANTKFENMGAGEGRIRINIPGDAFKLGKSKFKVLSGLAQDGKDFVTQVVKGSSDKEIVEVALKKFRSFLLYDQRGVVPIASGSSTAWFFEFILVPISGSTLLLPEEFPILLAFYHLGNVVRYDPEYLKRLLDSKASALIETLIRHGTFRFLVLFWSYVNRTTYFITP